jgi:hypothetical protein
VLAPLVAAGTVPVTDLYAALQSAAGAGSLGAPTALALAALLAAAVGAQGPAKAPTLEAAAAGSLSIVRLFAAPSRMAVKKVRDVLRAGGAELEAAFPELAALEDVVADVAEAATTPASANPAGQDELKARFAALPAAVTAGPAFARAIAAAAVHAALEDAGPEAAAAADGVTRLGEVLKALAASAGGSEAVGLELANGVQVAVVASVHASGEGAEAEAACVASAFKALHEAAGVPAAAFKAWAAGGAEPFGRESALAGAKAWAAGL